MEGLRWRSILAVLGVATAIVMVIPNVVHFGENTWWPTKAKLNYGLDIQGGVHLVMGVDIDGVMKESTGRLIASMKAEMAKESIAVTDVKSENPQMPGISGTECILYMFMYIDINAKVFYKITRRFVPDRF